MQFLEASEKVSSHLGGVLDQVLFLQSFNRRGGSSRRHRIRAEGRGVIERVRMKDAPDFVRRMKGRAGNNAA